jgi:anti-sigma regulatory factor (Ser/Thr protein kinase)
MAFESSPEAVSAGVAALLRFLSDNLPLSSVRPYELVLNEALRNALEHGNLGITEEEKKTFCDLGIFDEEIKRRAVDAQGRGLQIRVQVELDENWVSFVVADDGDGFDWRALPPLLVDKDSTTQLSGRGLFLMRNFFDEMEFNEDGNSVRLRKYLR